MMKNWENNGTEEIGLVTPTPGNGLVPSGKKPLSEPVLTQIYVAVRCY